MKKKESLKTETEKILESILSKDESKREVWNEVSQEVDFAIQLRKEREAYGLTQKEMSSKTGIKQSEISKIENAVISPTISTLIKYLNGIDKSLSITEN